MLNHNNLNLLVEYKCYNIRNGYLPTPKNRGQIINDQFSPNDGTRTGSIQARKTNSSVNGPYEETIGHCNSN